MMMLSPHMEILASIETGSRVTQLIAVHGCVHHLTNQDKIDRQWLDELRLLTTLWAAVQPVSNAAFSCISFADLLLSGGKGVERKRDGSPGNEGVPYVARQVLRYISDSGCRSRIRERIADHIGSSRSVVVAHSLGSVAAYEALCSMSTHNVHTLITLGSPLGLRRMFFNNLQSPMTAGRHSWPFPLAQWINISHPRDVVSYVSRLRPLFGNGHQVKDVVLHDGPRPHSLRSYLSASETRSAVAEALYAVAQSAVGVHQEVPGRR
jgi:hypothetical protein